jgi:uncharacterized membrane protein
MTISFTHLDAFALVAFVLAWIGYHFVSEGRPTSLNTIMAQRRRDWMRQMAERENRMPDSITMQGLQNGSAFFASTSLIAIGGALAALGASAQAVEVVTALPFGIVTTRELFDAKIFGLAAVFVYAFFKFVWAYRLFNYGSILIVCTPPREELGTPEMELALERAGRMNIEAGRHFNRGLRTLFFALAYLGWFVSPVALLATTVAVVSVLYRRQFRSEPVAAAAIGGQVKEPARRP